MMRKRERDNWIFSSELRDSIALEDEEKKLYALTPLGTKAKRVLFCGIVMSKQSDDKMTRVTVSDSLGLFYVSAFAGGFNPEEQKMLDSLETEDKIMLSGKINPFKTNEGSYIFSIRPEIVSKIETNEMDYWTIMTSYSTKKKIFAIREIMKIEDPDINKMVQMGYTNYEAECALAAIKNFKDYDFQKLMDGIETAVVSSKAEAKVPEARDMILKYIKENDSDGKGCKYEDIVVAARNMNVDQSTVDEVLNTLGSLGEIFEVSLKRYRGVEDE